MSDLVEKTLTNADLLQQKLNNYKAFLRQSNNGDQEGITHLEAMDKYGIQEFVVFGASTLMPLYRTGQMDVAIKKTCEHFRLKDEPEVAAKIGRYYQFLVDFLSQVIVE